MTAITTRAEHSRPEHALILRCVEQTIQDEHRVEPVHIDGFDWEYFFQTVKNHQITPLVYRCLSNGANHEIPPRVLDNLKTRMESIAFRNLKMTRTLHRVFEIFEEHDIRALPYKGPALSGAVYGDLAVRRWADLDILLSKEDVLTAREKLLDNGFQPKSPLTARKKRTVLRSARHVSVLTEDDIRIELHWTVTGRQFPFDFEFENLWATRTSADSTGAELPGISHEKLLLLLAVHGNRHCWQSLAWLCDVAGVVATTDFDWEHQLDVARRHGAKRMLLVGLALVRDLVGVECPSVVSEEIQADSAVMDLVRQVTETFLWEQKPADLRQLRYKFGVREQYADKFRMATRLAFSPTESDYDSMPATLQYYPLAVLYRPVRVARVGGESLKDAFITSGR